nr:deoxyribose-phosphate aldolase [Tessaracoccus coleopterorum]
MEDLAMLGALEGKLVIGSMNRSGIIGARYAVDDRVTAYDVPGIVGTRLDGGKLLLRIDPSDPATPTMLERTGAQVSALAAAGKIAMVEPFMAKPSGGGPVNQLDTESVIRSIAVASALGNTSAHTWLKVPCVEDMPRVMAATSLPCLMLGGDVPEDAGATLESWRSALKLPNVMGLVLGRALLFPRDGDVAANVEAIAEVL